MAEHILCGFGFGPIQGGLFVKEAAGSGNFSRLVVAEIDSRLVDAVKANKGTYYVNVAGKDGIDQVKVENVELLNPTVIRDRQVLLEALSQATEIVTSLPSVNFFETGGEKSVAAMIAEGLKRSMARATIVYTAENHNHAAEILEEAVRRRISRPARKKVQFLNTVIGKMSQVVTDPAEIRQRGLAPIAPGISRAFLVEQFNRILVTRTTIVGFRPGISVFIEKDDLLPFEEAKLYGHNAIHALLGFLGAVKGYMKMMQLKDDLPIINIAREAFLNESGAALIKKCAHLADKLFTEASYRDYVEDILERITNPYLADTVARACRDVVRKLGPGDRIFGTMRLALEYGIEPKNMALGAMAGLAVLGEKADEYNLPANLRFTDWRGLDGTQIEEIIRWVWKGQSSPYEMQLIEHTQAACQQLQVVISR
jgi:mannitol-1-phosphate 5-dehydrogenase